MFVRTVSRKKSDGSKVSYLQIVENVWNKELRRSQTKIVCTLGRVDGKGSRKLEQLAESIRRQSSFEDSWEHGAFHAVSGLWDQLGVRDILEHAVREEGLPALLQQAVREVSQEAEERGTEDRPEGSAEPREP